VHELFDSPDGSERSPRREPVPPRAWSVSQLTQRIRGLLEGLGRVSVEGEVSGGRPAASGHVYFDLKDLDAKVACVIWRSAVATALRQALREGDKVVVHGKVEVYGPRGGYQIIVQRVEPAGLGTLLAQLERLKQDLKERGWLDRRRPIPALPERVGVVTSRDGAAFQDFLRTRSQRWPLYPVVLSHTPVQGANAAQLIAAAIRRVAASGVDVVVVTRGGGSIEDLWAFNELAVAEAIWECPVPVVSGVGHETDTTLCDLVADLRAHTPTDAATQVIPDRRELVEALERGEGHLLDALQSQLEGRRERLERAASSRVLRDAHWILDERRERLARLEQLLAASVRDTSSRAASRLAELRRRLERRSPAQELARRSARIDVAGARLQAGAKRALESARRDVEGLGGRLAALSPLAVLARGYSITFAAGAKTPLGSVEGLSAGTQLETRLADGRVLSRVSDVQPDGR
jgi:exodeoxyribonuclease VII large subunit